MKAYVEHDDDIPIGRVLTRREIIGLLAGGAGTLLLAACGDATSTAVQGQVTAGSAATTAASSVTTAAATTAAATQSLATSVAATTSQATAAATTAQTTAAAATTISTLACVVSPEMTEGPYFVDEKINRSDIRSDPTDGSVREGATLRLVFNIAQVGTNGCTPYAGAYVDIWHCDAAGVYSDVQDNMAGASAAKKKFLRGYQVADANGKVEFTTIFPGWYRGRTVHIHFKVRNALGSAQTYTFTSQLFFDDSVADQIYAQAPYASKGQRSTKNSNDGIYRNGGSQMLLKLAKEGNGYTSTFNIGVKKA